LCPKKEMNVSVSMIIIKAQFYIVMNTMICIFVYTRVYVQLCSLRMFNCFPSLLVGNYCLFLMFQLKVFYCLFKWRTVIHSVLISIA